MATLVLRPSLYDEIEADVCARYPEEACGVLIGDAGDERSLAEAIRVEHNVHEGDRARRFSIDPERLLALQKEARSTGRQILGYYHSHPDAPAVPSRTDLEAAWPETSYLILSVTSEGVREARSWRMSPRRRHFAEEGIEYESA